MPKFPDRIGAKGGRALLEETAAGRPLRLVLRTRTRWDVGEWFRDAPVWAGLCDDALLLCAAGKRPLAESLPRETLRGSVYNAITGEVLFAPAPDAAISAVALPPVEGEALAAALREGPAPREGAKSVETSEGGIRDA